MSLAGFPGDGYNANIIITRCPKGEKMKPGDLLPAAIAFAHEKHASQKDKQGLPYILHPLAVMVNVVNHERYSALSEAERIDACCIAVLHDVVEDTDASLDDVQALLGRREITDGVAAMTHYEREELEQYWSRAKRNLLARIVKLCDLQHNTDPARIIFDEDIAVMERRQEKYRRAREFLKFD